MKSVCSLFLFFLSLNSYAQTVKGVVAGNLLDADNSKSIAGATISLKNIGDTTAFFSLVTDEEGGFQFDQLLHGYYSMQIKMLGYSPLRIDSINIREERTDFNLADTKMNRSASDMESVIIYAEKPLIENKDGKITFNTSESALSNSSNATELLKQTPLVTTDNDGKLLMKGKEVKILIDDKPVEMDARQLQDLLESMPGSMIEKIEVLTTPPPQYANERGGVINIVTKKGKVGKSGRLNINYGTRGEAGASASFSYRKNKISFNTSAGYSYNFYKGESYSIRENVYADSSNFFRTDGNNSSINNRPNGRASLDYELNKMNNFNITATLNSSDNEGESGTEYRNINQYDVLYRVSNRKVGSGFNAVNPSGSASYTHKWKNPGEVLRVIGNIAFSSNRNTRDFYQRFLQPDGTFNGDDSAQRQQTRSNNHTLALRINYDKPLKDKKTILNFGSTVNRYKLHNELTTSFLKKPDSIMVVNDLLSNNFEFYQTVYTIRAAIRYQFFTNFFTNVGVQQEYAVTSFDILGDSNHYPNNYYSTLPFANITRKWENGYSLTASYKRSVQRPGMNNLNPSVDYSDPYNTRFGNPYLQPYYADNFDFGGGYWKKKFNINASVGYNSLQHIYSALRTLTTDGKTITSWYNLSGRKEYEASMFGGVNIGKKLKLNASGSYTYNVYSDHDQKVNRYRNAGSLNSSMNGNYQWSSIMNFTGNFTFNRFANPQGTVRNRLSMSVGVQRKFFDKNLSVSLNMVDPFSQQQNTNFIYAPNYNLETYSMSNSRNFRVAAAYTFKKKMKKRVLVKKKVAGGVQNKE
ncbi:MAG: TonB-dependent receptor [Rhizobacter sp.]|nr:TonB-dependent receptor [Ferruginibacter sp.]